jgi:predicted RNase H-like HicB family nuclease
LRWRRSHATNPETRQLIREAIEFHIEGMRINGDAVPEPPHVEQIEVSA